jgi:hypothetical protein
MPIYSNIYYDFHTDWLQNYAPSAYYSWPVAILYAYYAEPVAAVEVPQEVIEGGEAGMESEEGNTIILE